MATTTGELGDTIPTIIQEADFTRQFKTVMRPLSWNIKKGKGSNINVPFFGQVVSRRLSENVDIITDEKMVDTNIQVVPYEAGLKVILTDNVIEDDNEDLIRAAGRVIGDAYEKKLDTDLLERLDSAASSLAGAGTTLTMGHIAAARAILLGNGASQGGPAPLPYVCVIHPNQELDLVDVLTPLVPTAATAGLQAWGGAQAEEAISRYSMGRLFGMPVISDGNLVADTADDIKGGVFASGPNGGILYGSAREPELKTTYDASLRGFELVYVGRYGVGNFHDGWTVELYTDASTPA